MKYRIVIDVCVDSKVEADSIMRLIQNKKGMLAEPFVNPASESLTIPRKVELWETYHDETPPKQCKLIGTLEA